MPWVVTAVTRVTSGVSVGALGVEQPRNEPSRARSTMRLCVILMWCMRAIVDQRVGVVERVAGGGDCGA